MIRWPSASSVMDTEVRILRSSSTRAMVGMSLLSVGGPGCAEASALKLAKQGRNVSGQDWVPSSKRDAPTILRLRVLLGENHQARRFRLFNRSMRSPHRSACGTLREL